MPKTSPEIPFPKWNPEALCSVETANAITMNVSCIRAGVKDLPSGDLIAKSLHVESCMANNPHFPAPVPSLATIAELRTDLTYWFQEAQGRSRAAVATRWVVHAQLERALVQLSKYVMAEAQGDIDRQVTSGFEMRRPPYRITMLEAPAPLLATRPNYEGSILLRWPAVHGARMYQVFANAEGPDCEGTWQMVFAGTARRTEIKGLAELTHYWFRVQAMGAAGVSAWSNTAQAKTR
jgi:hypothetical protein